MSKSILYMVTKLPGQVQDGYTSILEACGYKVYRCHPNNKLEIISLIEACNIEMIFSESKYGIRQLPIDKINTKQIVVIVNAFPLNNKKNYIDGPYTLADPKEPEILSSIDNLAVYTNVFPYAWEKYMQGWVDSEIDLLYVPYAGNMYLDIPNDLSPICDVSIHGENNHLTSILVDRLKILKRSIRLNAFPAVVHANISSKPYAAYQGFQYNLFGASWVDNILEIGPLSNTQFIQIIENSPIMNKETYTFDLEIAVVAAQNYTYFNRLYNILDHIGQESIEIKATGDRMATQFIWKLQARLEEMKKGKTHEEVQFI